MYVFLKIINLLQSYQYKICVYFLLLHTWTSIIALFIIRQNNKNIQHTWNLKSENTLIFMFLAKSFDIRLKKLLSVKDFREINYIKYLFPKFEWTKRWKICYLSMKSYCKQEFCFSFKFNMRNFSINSSSMSEKY